MLFVPDARRSVEDGRRNQIKQQQPTSTVSATISAATAAAIASTTSAAHQMGAYHMRLVLAKRELRSGEHALLCASGVECARDSTPPRLRVRVLFINFFFYHQPTSVNSSTTAAAAARFDSQVPRGRMCAPLSRHVRSDERRVLVRATH